MEAGQRAGLFLIGPSLAPAEPIARRPVESDILEGVSITASPPFQREMEWPFSPAGWPYRTASGNRFTTTTGTSMSSSSMYATRPPGPKASGIACFLAGKVPA